MLFRLCLKDVQIPEKVIPVCSVAACFQPGVESDMSDKSFCSHPVWKYNIWRRKADHFTGL